METVVITCDCTVCKGRQARVRQAFQGSPRQVATVNHNLVCIAHSPLARTASALEFGPWKV